MTKVLTPAERLIVAADFKPKDSRELEICSTDPAGWVRDQLLGLTDDLRDLDVVIKANSIVFTYGFRIIDDINSRGLKAFVDGKFNDIPETMGTIGALLRPYNPYLLTAMCSAGKGVAKLKEELPDTEVLGVTVLTTFNDAETEMIFGCKTVDEAVVKMAGIGGANFVDGFISSPKEAAMIREGFGYEKTINTPGVRPYWAVVEGDDQNPDRVLTPRKAIYNGADRVIMGRPILQAKNRRDAVLRTIDEIAEAAV